MHALSTAALLISAVGLPSLVSAVSIDCKKIVADETTFNINPLAGEHSVSHTRDSGVEGHTTNNTYTFNLCAPLRLSRDSKVEAGCRHGSYGKPKIPIRSSLSPQIHQQIVPDPRMQPARSSAITTRTQRSSPLPMQSGR